MDIKVDTNTVVCFDLDDTLYNEIEYLKSSYKEIAQHLEGHHWKPLYARMFSLYRQKNDVFSFLTETYTTISKEQLLTLYRNHKPNITLFPEIRNIFDAIKKHGGILVVITDGRSVTQRNKIQSLGIQSYLDRIVISEEIGTEKPSETNFKVIEEDFENGRYYYFGDNFKKDFITPNKRNWISVGLLDNGLNIHNNTYAHYTEGLAPQHLIASFREVKVVSAQD
ncbi:HAD family hydrolase [Spongiimicrobium salis]|uniref:HAD family hydrolase n=1 Tax=Spongiimicrobium salis TaxID=1667022 RepID=UPI00374D3DB5